MGGSNADLDVETSVSGIRHVIENHQQESVFFTVTMVKQLPGRK